MPRQLKNLTIGEISIVDKPAHVPALAALEKAANKGGKTATLTKAQLQELRKALSIDLYAYFYSIYDEIDLEIAVAKLDRLVNAEIPAIAKMIQDQAEALGLTDSLPTDGVFAEMVNKSVNKNDKEAGMPKENDPAVEKSTDELNAEIAALTKQRDEAVAALEKAKNAAPESEPAAPEAPVYKARDGREYREPESIELAKRLDEEQADRELEARVNKDFAHIPGDLATRKAIVKAMDAIPDEAQRKAALDNLTQRDAELAEAFKRNGDSGQAVADRSSVEAFEKALEGKENPTQSEVDAAFAKAHKDWAPNETGAVS